MINTQPISSWISKKQKRQKLWMAVKPPGVELKLQNSAVDDIDDLTFQMEPWLS